MEKKIPIFLVLAGAAVAAAIGVTAIIQSAAPPPRLPVLGKVGEFKLTSENGIVFDQARLKNRVWIADFIADPCRNSCSVKSANMAQLERSYDLEKDVRFVSVAGNPGKETVQHLREYARKLHAAPEKWFFLTGKREEIVRLARQMSQAEPLGKTVLHSPELVLIDRQKRIRGYYNGTKRSDVRRLFKAIAVLLENGS